MHFHALNLMHFFAEAAALPRGRRRRRGRCRGSPSSSAGTCYGACAVLVQVDPVLPRLLGDLL